MLLYELLLCVWSFVCVGLCVLFRFVVVRCCLLVLLFLGVLWLCAVRRVDSFVVVIACDVVGDVVRCAVVVCVVVYGVVWLVVVWFVPFFFPCVCVRCVLLSCVALLKVRWLCCCSCEVVCVVVVVRCCCVLLCDVVVFVAVCDF